MTAAVRWTTSRICCWSLTVSVSKLDVVGGSGACLKSDGGLSGRARKYIQNGFVIEHSEAFPS